MASEACCAAGAPVPGSYEHRGSMITLGEGDGGDAASAPMKMYVVRAADMQSPPAASSLADKCVVLAYDIFGMNTANRNVFRMCDLLVEGGVGMVCMPDFYRGNNWLIENFPPTDWAPFTEWFGSTASVPDALAAARSLVLPYVRAQAGINGDCVGAVGTCWGGLFTVSAAAHPDLFTAVGGIHYARVTPELAAAAVVPVMLLASKDEPDQAPLKSALNAKPFGAQCVYKRYDTETHGWCAARGDWTNAKTHECAHDAVKHTLAFFGATLK